MDWTLLLSVGALAWLAFAIKVVGFLCRDELILRALLCLGTTFTVLYYLNVADVPIWDGAVSNAILGLVNLAMIVVIAVERSRLFMGPEARALHAEFGLMTPGQVRRLLRAATRHAPDADMVLTRTGTVPDRLFYVRRGPVRLCKGDALAPLPAASFVGEVALVTGSAASADVIAGPGADILSWPAHRLSALFRRSPGLRNAMMAVLNRDLAAKVARSRPVAAQAD